MKSQDLKFDLKTLGTDFRCQIMKPAHQEFLPMGLLGADRVVFFDDWNGKLPMVSENGFRNSI